MMRRSCMFAGMLIRRAVTTARAAAFLAGPQVHPLGANLHALLALASFRMFYRCDGPNMFAGCVGHCCSFSLMIHTRKASGNRIRVGAGGGRRDNNTFHSGVDDCEKTNTLCDLVAHGLKCTSLKRSLVGYSNRIFKLPVNGLRCERRIVLSRTNVIQRNNEIESLRRKVCEGSLRILGCRSSNQPKARECLLQPWQLAIGTRQVEAALADFDKAVEITPCNAMAFNNRGIAKLGLGDMEGAVADFNRAIKLNPEHPE